MHYTNIFTKYEKQFFGEKEPFNVVFRRQEKFFVDKCQFVLSRKFRVRRAANETIRIVSKIVYPPVNYRAQFVAPRCSG